MRRILLTAFLLLFVPAGVHAWVADYPADLAKWLVTEPPGDGDDRWWDAYRDSEHYWVVSLQAGQPSARLWVSKREPGSSYPRTQESYPVLPFKVNEDDTQEGHSGEWLSKKVDDGWIIGFNKGEWGGALWWYSPDGKKRVKISKDQVIRFVETESGLLALAGCAHAFANDGSIVRLTKGSDGLWHSELVVDLKDTPGVAFQDREGTLLVSTYRRLLRIDPATKKVDVLMNDIFWGGLGPNSMIGQPDGSIWIGASHGVVELDKSGKEYKAKWLIPDAEYAKAAVANRREGFR